MLIALSLPLNSDDGDSGADRMRHCILIERIAPLSNERQGNLKRIPYRFFVQRASIDERQALRASIAGLVYEDIRNVVKLVLTY
jgi:hypothetical protein